MRLDRQILTGVIVCVLLSGATAHAQEARQCPMGREYYLYLPKQVDPGKTYWLVAGIHGFRGNGKGAGGYGNWATQRDDVIVVGPSFPVSGEYTQGEGDSCDQLIGIHNQLSETYKLHEKMFVAGFSGGSQFAHRFAMLHPDRVVGFAAHSGGSWATGGPWKSLNPAAKTIPFVMSCGEADTAKMHPDAPFGRLEWAKQFEQQARDGGYTFKAAYFPGVAHKASPGVWAMSKECFELATVFGSGLSEGDDRALTAIRRQAERGSVPGALSLAERFRAEHAGPKTTPRLPDGWTVGESMKTKLASAGAESVEAAINDALRPAVDRGLEMVKQVIDRDAPGRDDQLARLRKIYEGLPEVEQAIDAATGK